MIISQAQIKAARALLGITQGQLAKMANCSLGTICGLELHGHVKPSTMRQVTTALTSRRVRFMKGGVRVLG